VQQRAGNIRKALQGDEGSFKRAIKTMKKAVFDSSSLLGIDLSRINCFLLLFVSFLGELPNMHSRAVWVTFIGMFFFFTFIVRAVQQHSGLTHRRSYVI